MARSLNSRQLLLRSGAAALAAALCAGPAFAQDKGEDDSKEIIVTAQKREQALTDVPIAIQAFSGEQLEEQGTKELNDLIESIPGASSVSRTAPGFETIQRLGEGRMGVAAEPGRHQRLSRRQADPTVHLEAMAVLGHHDLGVVAASGEVFSYPVFEFLGDARA